MFVHPKEGSGWLLLRHAVHCSKSPDEISRVDRDNPTRREEFRERIESNAVIRPIEYWGEYYSVGDIEICIAGRQAAVFKNDGLRHWQFDNCELATILIASCLQSAEIRTQGRMIHIF